MPFGPPHGDRFVHAVRLELAPLEEILLHADHLAVHRVAVRAVLPEGAPFEPADARRDEHGGRDRVRELDGLAHGDLRGPCRGPLIEPGLDGREPIAFLRPLDHLAELPHTRPGMALGERGLVAAEELVQIHLRRVYADLARARLPRHLAQRAEGGRHALADPSGLSQIEALEEVDELLQRPLFQHAPGRLQHLVPLAADDPRRVVREDVEEGPGDAPPVRRPALLRDRAERGRGLCGPRGGHHVHRDEVDVTALDRVPVLERPHVVR